MEIRQIIENVSMSNSLKMTTALSMVFEEEIHKEHFLMNFLAVVCLGMFAHLGQNQCCSE